MSRIWVIGSPRSGTTFVAEFLGSAAEHLFNEPFAAFPKDRPDTWVLPEGCVVFKYCSNSKHADLLAKRFPGSKFVHVVRNPDDVVYSMCRPKPDSSPHRPFTELGAGEARHLRAADFWHYRVSEAARCEGRHPTFVLRYETVEEQTPALADFTGLALDPARLRFVNRNDPYATEWAKPLWRMTTDAIRDYRETVLARYYSKPS